MKRVKRRYLAVQVERELGPTEREFIDAVWAAVTRLYGEVGASQTGLVLIDFNLERQVAVIRVTIASMNMVRGSLSTITSIAGMGASVRVLSVSGTIKALFSSGK
ncbi:MAG TPA: Rpp14/Pop5 family protein [Candidatus Bathyarchaeia archaeon]|nr:Rpp14/Pop5 family protein [Candidatus Bathyarchaeia archaeon]